jgi:ribonuclease D
MNYTLIETKAELLSYLKKLEEEKHYIIALDMEGESNLHAYGERLCLIQIFDGINRVIVDPFQIYSGNLKLLFENTNILKVMYQASSDLSLLKNTYNIDIKSIMDLGPAIELLHYKDKGLHSVIAFELGIALEHKSKYQKYNWIRRPISKQAINYALHDVIHLLALKDSLLKKLYAKKLLDLFMLKNLQIQNKDYSRNPEDKYKKIKGYSSLQDAERTVFRNVFDIRDKYAQICNVPPHYVISKTDLINIAINAKCITEIHFPKRFTTDLVQDILHELRNVTRSV